MKTTVIHIKHASNTATEVNVMRPSKYGNPYVIGKDGSRDDVISAFNRLWYSNDRAAKTLRDDALQELKGKKLVCCCHPLQCHANVIADYVNNHYDNYLFSE